MTTVEHILETYDGLGFSPFANGCVIPVVRRNHPSCFGHQGPEGSKYRDGVVAAIGSGGVAGRQRSDGWKSGSAVRSRGWQGWI